MSRGNLLTLLIILGLAAGCLYGQLVLHDSTSPIGADHWTKQAGDLILVRPLMLMIVPLVFVSVVAGVTSIGDPSRLGLVGGSTVLYYITTMLIAVTIGATLVSFIRPGDLSADAMAEVLIDQGVVTDAQLEQARAHMDQAGGRLPDALVSLGITDEESIRAATRGALQADAERVEMGAGQITDNLAAARSAQRDTFRGAWLNLLDQFIPSNIVKNMAETNTLAVIVAAVLFGLALAMGGSNTELVVRVFDQLFDAMMRLVMWIIWLTPIGVFLLVAWTVGAIGLGELAGKWAKYIATVLIGLAIHGAIVLPVILYVFSRTNPYRFMWQMRRALLTAFGTDSSSATLPVTIQSAETEGGCSKRATNFVLPLGATVNMDGTAIYEAVAVVFLCQLWGIDLGMSELIIVMITATLAAIGAAGIPSAGIITMLIVIGAVNTSLAGRGVETLPPFMIFIVIAVDRIVDMCRTTVNVWGDAVGAKLITRIAPDTEDEREKALA